MEALDTIISDYELTVVSLVQRANVPLIPFLTESAELPGETEQGILGFTLGSNSILKQNVRRNKVAIWSIPKKDYPSWQKVPPH